MMTALNWTWEELMDTPWDIVQRTRVYLSVRNAIETKTSLKFPEGTP